MTLTKRNLFCKILPLLLLLVLIVGCQRVEEQQTKVANEEPINRAPKSIPFCTNLENPKERVVCFLNLAEETQDVIVCDYIEDINLIGCYINIAGAKRDISICKRLATKVNYDVRVYGDYNEGCYAKVAVATKNISMCAELQEYSAKNGCYFNIAIEVQDTNLCKAIEEYDLQNECYFELAIKKKDSTVCDFIKGDRDLKQQCYDEYASPREIS